MSGGNNATHNISLSSDMRGEQFGNVNRGCSVRYNDGYSYKMDISWLQF